MIKRAREGKGGELVAHFHLQGSSYMLAESGERLDSHVEV